MRRRHIRANVQICSFAGYTIPPDSFVKNYLRFLAALGGLFTLVNPSSGAPFVLSDVVTNSNSGYFLAVGDVNGDDKPDLVSVNNNNTITIATNAGDGIFVSNATYNVGTASQISAPAIADINGDGKPDLVTLNAGNNTVLIFTNAGGGILVSNASYAVGNYPFFLLVTDVNGDGKPDIITANANDGTLTILTNAAGVFRVSQTLLVVNSNSFAAAFAVADINGDERPDIIAGDYSDGLIEVFTNAGGGNFVSNAVYAAGSANFGGPLSVLAADFNNDGKIDIATGNQDSSVTIFTNSGDGALKQTQSFVVPGYPGDDLAIMAADVDGDGYTDLLVSAQSGGDPFIATLYNSGSGGIFITNYLNNPDVINTILPTSFNWAGSVAVDVNSDGKPDLLGVNGDYLYVLTNGVGSFPNGISISVPATNITVEATSASGAVVNFATTAANWIGSWPVTNTPPSGSTFPIGATTVTSSMGYFVKSDISGSATTSFTVTVEDTNAPVITLLGANPLAGFVDGYVDPGATATDSIYGNLTGSIVVSGNLNTNVAGTYTVTYSVTDPAGNSATTNRTVVLDPLPALGVAATPANQTALFWAPATNGSFIIQTTTNLAEGNWVTVTNGRPLIGFYVTNTAPAAFFRLQPQ